MKYSYSTFKDSVLQSITKRTSGYDFTGIQSSRWWMVQRMTASASAAAAAAVLTATATDHLEVTYTQMITLGFILSYIGNSSQIRNMFLPRIKCHTSLSSPEEYVWSVLYAFFLKLQSCNGSMCLVVVILLYHMGF